METNHEHHPQDHNREGDKLMNTNSQTAIKERKMNVTTPNLIRAAGLSAVIAGTIFAVIQPIQEEQHRETQRQAD